MFLAIIPGVCQMTRTVDDLQGGTFEIPANPPIPADDDTDEEREVFETIWGAIETKEQTTNG